MSDDAPREVMGLNPFEPGYFADPYAQYAAVRAANPIHQSPLGPWLITRWDDVHALLRTPGTSVEERNIVSDGPTRTEQLAEVRMARGLDPHRSLAILNIDPPDHTRIRRLVSKAFTPRAVERIRARAGELVDEILDDMAGRDEPVDLISELAFPLPFTVISEMLGMPDGDRLHLRELSHTITQALDPLLVMANGEAIIEAAVEMRGIVGEAIDWKRGRPDDDDLLQALIRAEDEGDVLSDAELLENVVLLFLAGHETTVNLIGNGVHALLDHPAQLAELAADPSLDANATEELLRWDSPVQFSRRIMLQSVEMDGYEFEAGSLVMTCLGAANRDPDKFGPTAGELDLRRTDAREHVSFGSGVHHCLGAALARLEGQEAIGRLVRRFPAIERAGDPVHNERIVLRGFDALPVRLG